MEGTIHAIIYIECDVLSVSWADFIFVYDFYLHTFHNEEALQTALEKMLIHGQ